MNPSDQIRLLYCILNRDYALDLISQHEVRAAIPPANCSEPELFSETQLNHVKHLRAYVALKELEIALLQGQGELALT